MPKLITTDYLNQIQFYQMPKAFFNNPCYMPMKIESKVAYTIIRDLLPLSVQNGWVNENNEIYVKLSQQKLMLKLGIKGTQKMNQVMKELQQNELIVYKQVGLNKCNEIYIAIPEDLTIIYTDEELLELDKKNDTESIENNRTFENQKSGVLKIKSQEIRKSKVKSFENQKHINTNIIKTNNINNNKKQQQQEKEKVVVADSQSSPEENISRQGEEPILNAEIYNTYVESFGKKPTKAVKRVILGYLKKFEEDVVIHALEMAGNDGKDFKYAKGIFKIWKEKGVFTFDDIVQYDMEFQATKNRSV